MNTDLALGETVFLYRAHRSLHLVGSGAAQVTMPLPRVLVGGTARRCTSATLAVDVAVIGRRSARNAPVGPARRHRHRRRRSLHEHPYMARWAHSRGGRHADRISVSGRGDLIRPLGTHG